MLASTASSAPEAMASFERASVEWKLDGIRIQIHRRGDEVRVYTRNLNDITETLPGIVRAVRALPVSQAVLDGEALWMSEDGSAAFQDTVARIDRDAPPEGIATDPSPVSDHRHRGDRTERRSVRAKRAGRGRVFRRAFRRMRPFSTLWSVRSEPEGSIKGSIPTARWRSCNFPSNKKRRFAALLQSPLTGSNRRPPLYEEGPCVKLACWCIAQSGRARWRWWVASWAHLSIASWWGDKADWGSLRWRISLRTVRRPGGRWRLWERRAGCG
jgi:ATP dependent DNA ligase domain